MTADAGPGAGGPPPAPPPGTAGADAIGAPVPGSTLDVVRVRVFAALLALRLAVALGLWYLVRDEVFWTLVCAVGPLVGAARGLAAAVRIGRDRSRAAVDAATAGFFVFVATCVYGFFGVLSLAYGLFASNDTAAWIGVGLLAFVPVDYGLLRFGLHAVRADGGAA